MEWRPSSSRPTARSWSRRPALGSQRGDSRIRARDGVEGTRHRHHGDRTPAAAPRAVARTAVGTKRASDVGLVAGIFLLVPRTRQLTQLLDGGAQELRLALERQESALEAEDDDF